MLLLLCFWMGQLRNYVSGWAAGFRGAYVLLDNHRQIPLCASSFQTPKPRVTYVHGYRYPGCPLERAPA
jgi:hypothetical protein